LTTILTGRHPFRNGVRRDGQELQPGVRTLFERFADAGFQPIAWVDSPSTLREMQLLRGEVKCVPPEGSGQEAVERIEALARAGKRLAIFCQINTLHWPFLFRRTTFEPGVDSLALDLLKDLAVQVGMSGARRRPGESPDEVSEFVNRLRDHVCCNGLMPQIGFALYAAGLSRLDATRLEPLLQSFGAIDLLKDACVSILGTMGAAVGEPWMLPRGAGGYYRQPEFGDLDGSPASALDVPWVIHREGLAPRVVDRPVAAVDVLPTLAGIFHLPLGADETDGVDLEAAGASGERPAYAEAWDSANQALWQRSIRHGRHKLIVSRGLEPVLYDLDSDPFERCDLLGGSPLGESREGDRDATASLVDHRRLSEFATLGRELRERLRALAPETEIP
jgi:hypothetical protein